MRPLQRFIAMTCCAIVVCASLVRADNAGFAIAPKNARFAIDAYAIADMLEGEKGAAVRPMIEALAGKEALATFDFLARRCDAHGDLVAREVFAGRMAFFLVDMQDGPTWVFGIEGDDARCLRVTRLLGAKMLAPGRFESPTERLALRRVGGWLLIAPSGPVGEKLIAASAARVPVEDAANSLLGEPLLQNLLAVEAPVRVFMRHGAPMGGATTIALRGGASSIRAEVTGNYERLPFSMTTQRGALDAHLVRAFEDRAVMMVANPADGKPGTSDAFWMALLPEIAPSPAMRANFSGERVFAVGTAGSRDMPAMAFAWRVEDAEQAEADQEHYMRGLCCGLTRAIERPRPKPGGASAAETDAGEPAHSHAGEQADLAAHRCAELGPFADRYLGAPFKLGKSVLCWGTVATPCGGWQVYSSDPSWLAVVSERLSTASCDQVDERPKAGGVGFCDGPRAATLLRRWQPLAAAGDKDRVALGLAALSDTMERLGRVRFQYELPTPSTIRATVEIEPLGRLTGQPARTVETVRDAGSAKPR